MQRRFLGRRLGTLVSLPTLVAKVPHPPAHTRGCCSCNLDASLLPAAALASALGALDLCSGVSWGLLGTTQYPGCVYSTSQKGQPRCLVSVPRTVLLNTAAPRMPSNVFNRVAAAAVAGLGHLKAHSFVIRTPQSTGDITDSQPSPLVTWIQSMSTSDVILPEVSQLGSSEQSTGHCNSGFQEDTEVRTSDFLSCVLCSLPQGRPTFSIK